MLEVQEHPWHVGSVGQWGVDIRSFAPHASCGSRMLRRWPPSTSTLRAAVDAVMDGQMKPTEKPPLRSAEVKPPLPSSQKLQSIKDFAASIGISVWTVRGWAYSGRIASIKLGARLTGQLAPGYALRELARQPTETRTNNPKEIQSTEKLGLDSVAPQSAPKQGGFSPRKKIPDTAET